MGQITAIPAYGADYKSRKEVEEAWENNKDFQIQSITSQHGRYINKQDAERYGVNSIRIRYQNKTKVHTIKVGE